MAADAFSLNGRTVGSFRAFVTGGCFGGVLMLCHVGGARKLAHGQRQWADRENEQQYREALG